MNADAVEHYLRGLQQDYCAAFEQLDGSGRFSRDQWRRQEGGGGVSRILEDGAVLERAGVGFSLVQGERLPPSATQLRPELAGRGFSAMGVSVVVHPRNPYAPTSHCNVRLLLAEKKDAAPVWWFGGGFDLTPYYGFDQDCRDWHSQARAACEPFGATIYPKLKKWCDEYFYLKHRGEPRGIGGLFFDDWTEGGFDKSFALMQSVATHYLKAYLPIVQRRKDLPHGERERQWQLQRRGRYVEFNLVWDRGTLFGLQSGGRTESILMSMPPLAAWRHDDHPPAGSPEEKLLKEFLVARNWL